jgi:predicted nuclease of predicted toxin-antitoxin system
MRFLADENVPNGIVEELIAGFHDVQWAAKLTPGALDIEILRRAAVDDRILLTFDTDYGDLAHSVETTVKPAGIILIRSPCRGRETLAARWQL